MTAPTRRFLVVVPAGRAIGFALAGVPVEEAGADGARDLLRDRIADPGIGVLAVESSLVPSIPLESRVRAAREGLPVILPFTLPVRHLDEAAGQDYVAALIRDAIGYHIKVGGAR